MPSPKTRCLSISLIFEFLDFFVRLYGELATWSSFNWLMSSKSKDQISSVPCSSPTMPLKHPEGGVVPTGWKAR